MKTEEIEIKGDAIESFERVEKIKEIILLGDKGGIRRIIFDEKLEDVLRLKYGRVGKEKM